MLQRCNIERHEVIHPEYAPDPNSKGFDLSGNYIRNPMKRSRKKGIQKRDTRVQLDQTMNIQPQTSFQHHEPQQNSQPIRQANILNSQPNFRLETQPICGQELLNNFLQQEQPAFNDINRYE